MSIPSMTFKFPLPPIPPIALGQTWQTRGGGVVRVDSCTPDSPWPWYMTLISKPIADQSTSWSVDETGHECGPTAPSPYDLVMLLKGADSTPAPTSASDPVDLNDPARSSRGDDPVDHPAHYTMGAIEVIDAIEDWQLNYHRGQVIKYVSRAGRKDPRKEIEDLQKAEWYLNREIGRLQSAADATKGSAK